MKTLRFLIALLGLAQVSTCARHFVTALNWQTFAPVAVPTSYNGATVQSARCGDGVLVVSSDGGARRISAVVDGEWRTLARVSPSRIFGEDLITGENGRWWCGIADDRSDGPGVWIVVGQKDGAMPPQFISAASTRAIEWHALGGDTPRGAFFSFAKSGLTVFETTLSGIRALGTIPTTAYTMGAELRSIQPLPDGRIVVAAIDGTPGSSSRLTLQSLPAAESSGAAPQRFVDCAGFTLGRIKSAISPKGDTLAIVAVSAGPKSGLWVILMDPDQPENARCTKLTSSVGPPGTAAITWAGDHFLAVWTTRDNLLHARNVPLEGSLTNEVVLGRAAIAGDLAPSIQLRQYDEERLAIAYNTPDGPRLRIVPNHVAGFAFADDLVKLLSADAPPSGKRR